MGGLRGEVDQKDFERRVRGCAGAKEMGKTEDEMVIYEQNECDPVTWNWGRRWKLERGVSRLYPH